jgi:hypothetical protein
MGRTLQIVWASLLASIGFYVTVAVVAFPDSTGDFVTSSAIGGMALVPAVLSLAWGRVVATTMPSPSVWYVRWALGEAVALFALVARAVGAPWTVAGALFALAVVVIAVQFPRDPGGEHG